MKTPDDFYAQRDQRTLQAAGIDRISSRHVFVDIGADACTSTAGQTCALALLNMLGRVHRNITVSLGNPAAPLLVPAYGIAALTLAASVLSLLETIDPFGSFFTSQLQPANSVGIGLGVQARDNLDWYIGAERFVGKLEPAPTAFSADRSSLVGAGVSACLGACAIFRVVHSLDVVPRLLSAWNYREDKNASPGPAEAPILDVGRVVMVGAGAVGSAVAYWTIAFGRGTDPWTVVDADVVKLHNTNRGLLFFPEHTDWFGQPPQSKAHVVANAIGAELVSTWYREAGEVDLPYDLVLALANEHGVRQQIAARGWPIALQATTGVNWLSQLHRHIQGVDDCVACRTAGVTSAHFSCSTAALPSVTDDSKSEDAALPFLSAASGLMLVSAMMQLAAGVLDDHAVNDWRWDFASVHRMPTPAHRSCKRACTNTPSPALSAKVNSENRWKLLDPRLALLEKTRGF